MRCLGGERLMHTLDREGDEYEEMVNVRIKWWKRVFNQEETGSYDEFQDVKAYCGKATIEGYVWGHVGGERTRPEWWSTPRLEENTMTRKNEITL